jgi:phospholipid/cholesterol/gamma-HCH transport system substrate-binding protein
VDAVLAEAQGIGANVRGATTDLGSLRAEVEANLRKIEGMINELNRKWPFARDTEVKLP